MKEPIYLEKVNYGEHQMMIPGFGNIKWFWGPNNKLFIFFFFFFGNEITVKIFCNFCYE